MPIRQRMEYLSNNTLLVYADDIVIIGNTRQEVMTRINDLIRATYPIGLEVNQDQTKYLIMTRDTRDHLDLVVGTIPSNK